MRFSVLFSSKGKVLLKNEFLRFAVARSYATSFNLSQELISPTELTTEIRRNKDAGGPPVKLIDTRSQDDFSQGHIPGAVNIPHFADYLIADSKAESMKSLQDDFIGYLGEAGIQRTDRTVVYDVTLEKTSPRALFLLKYLGCPNVSLLHGGLALWQKEKLPICQSAQRVSPVYFQAELNNDIMVTRYELIEAVKNPESVTIVDDRNEPEWLGESSSPYGVDFCPRKGRIPGAIWIEWLKLMQTDKDGICLYKSPEEMARICQSSGATDFNKPVYVYCFKGARASNTWLAMRLAGYKDVKTYFGSWNEWSRDTNLPVDDMVADNAFTLNYIEPYGPDRVTDQRLMLRFLLNGNGAWKYSQRPTRAPMSYYQHRYLHFNKSRFY